MKKVIIVIVLVIVEILVGGISLKTIKSEEIKEEIIDTTRNSREDEMEQIENNVKECKIEQSAEKESKNESNTTQTKKVEKNTVSKNEEKVAKENVIEKTEKITVKESTIGKTDGKTIKENTVNKTNEKTIKENTIEKTENKTQKESAEIKDVKKKEEIKQKENKVEEVKKETFNIEYWISYAINYGQNIGLQYDKTATECWDNPIIAGENVTTIQRDIQGMLNRYKNVEGFTDFCVWTEQRADGKFNIYIGYA